MSSTTIQFIIKSNIFFTFLKWCVELLKRLNLFVLPHTNIFHYIFYLWKRMHHNANTNSFYCYLQLWTKLAYQSITFISNICFPNWHLHLATQSKNCHLDSDYVQIEALLCWWWGPAEVNMNLKSFSSELQGKDLKISPQTTWNFL